MKDIPIVRSFTHGRRSGLAMLATALLLGVSIPRADAQLTTGTIAGGVRDAQEAAVSDVKVSLVSETRGTRPPDAVTSASGDFVFPNLSPDTYTLEVARQGFKTLRRTGIAVSPGDRIGLGLLTLEIGATTESVTVTSEAPQLQTQSAERSFTVTQTEVRNLPISNRNFTSLTALLPGVSGTSRMGDQTSFSGGNTNIMMDGVSTMDSGNNAAAIQVNSEAVAEVKVMVSNYQAEYGRQSGMQISAVTKSGTNQFHGSGFMVMRQSGWNANSKANILNGFRKGYNKEKDLGFTVGGPIGKPGGDNKLFFFYSHEFDPRKINVGGNNVSGGIVSYRFPTALERAGNFSQTTDNNGNPFTNIIDPTTLKPFPNSIIPASSQYALGAKILNLYPMPNLTGAAAYNYQAQLPAQNIMSQEPIIKIDYMPWEKLRVSGKLTLWEQPATKQSGTLPGFNDTQVYKKWFYMWAITATYNFGPTTFAEFTVGRTRNDLAGCFGPTNGVAPGLCTSSIPVNDVASMKGSGLTGLPRLFPDAGLLNKEYYAYQAMQSLKPPIWDGNKMDLVPQFGWGGRVNGTYAPPNFPFPGWLNTNQNNDMVFSLTKLVGSHTIKGGIYYTHSYKAQQSLAGTWQGNINFGNDANNSLDSGFGFSNALLGVFSNYSQLSKYVEGNYVFDNVEAFIQDNWKATPRLTLDYGVRLVHQPPQHDKLGQGVNFLPDQWSLSKAPVYYTAGCAVAQAPGAACSSSNRRAVNPLTGQQLPAVAIGTLVPGSGNFANGMVASGTDPVPSGTYYWPWLAPAPRLGVAYDLTGKQKIVIRGGLGLTFDRPSGNTVFSLIANPPNQFNQTLYYSQLQNMGGLTTQSASNLNVYQLHSDLPSNWNWSAGVQYMMPFDTMLDVTYTGLHGFNNVLQTNVNSVDFGAAFLPQNQDPTAASNVRLGSGAVTQNQMRAIRGYGSITMMQPRGTITSQFLQVGINHRFSRGVQFLINDTIALKRSSKTGLRIQHDANGNFSVRPDQAQADAYENYIGTRHTFKGGFVWSMPSLLNNQKFVKTLTRDWQLSGIWSASSPSTYTVSASFQDGTNNQNITGSPDWSGRVKLIGDPGSGCSGDPYKMFNTSAFAAPQVGSLGLESGNDYMRGCWQQQYDLALQRDFRLGGETRRLSIRIDAYNAFNQSHVNGRNTGMQVKSLTDPTITNLPFDTAGNLVPSRSKPNSSGFGMATGWQGPRTIQAWLRFTF